MVFKITLEELEAELSIILHALRVQRVSKLNLVKDVSVQFVCEDFGTVISGIKLSDYGYVAKAVREQLPNHRYVYVSDSDDLIEAKEKIIWALMCGGYMKYVREKFNNQFKQFLVIQDYANKIIDERLKRWADRPKYKFMIQENLIAKTLPANMILSSDPGFFDYMPEEEV